MAAEIPLLLCVPAVLSEASVGGAAFNPNVLGSRLGLVKAAANICLPLPLVTLAGMQLLTKLFVLLTSGASLAER